MVTRNPSGKSNGKSLVPAAGYIRVSTDKQEDSPEQQRAEILKLAEREGFQVIRWYDDYAISGAKTLKRPGFLQLIEDAKSGKYFKAILCWDQDRFGRFDSLEAGEWISPLRRAGVQLITVNQGRIDWDDFAGRLMYQITQEGKHRYLIDLSRNALRGMIQHAQRGCHLGSPTPYGYDRVYFDANGREMCRVRRRERFRKPRDWSAKLVPSAESQEIDTVRWLFETFADGNSSSRSLALELNRGSVPSPTNGRWTFFNIRKILQNPVYVGCYAYGRRPAGMYHHVGPDGEITTERTEWRKCERYAPILVKNNHEPLVTEEVFHQVQAKLRERASHPGRPRTYLLSGILRCGHCGGPLLGHLGSPGRDRKKKPYTYYKCKNAAVAGTCEFYSVRTELIEQELTRHFRDVWLSENGQVALRRAIGSISSKRKRAEPRRSAALKAQLTALERQIEQGTQNLLLASLADVPAASALLTKWRAQRDRLRVNVDSLTEPAEECTKLDPDAVIGELAHIEEHLASGNAPLARLAFSRVFKAVTLFWQRVSPRRRELARAIVEAEYPFCLTGRTSIRAQMRCCFN